MDESPAGTPQGNLHELTHRINYTDIYVLVTPSDLKLDPLVGKVSDDGAGAVATFSGVTRDTFNGKGVLRLEYEAYEPMALKKMAVRLASAQNAPSHSRSSGRRTGAPCWQRTAASSVKMSFRHRACHLHGQNLGRRCLDCLWQSSAVQTLLRFRMGCHNLPWDLGRRQGIPRLHRVCTLCAGENPGDEQHVVFECPGLQDIRDRYQGLFGEHAATMLQFVWQDDIRGVAMVIKECLGVYCGTDPDGGQASDQP